MDKRTKTVLSIALGVLLAAGLVVVGMIGTFAYAVASHVHSEEASQSTAGGRFEEVRERFSNQLALVEIEGLNTVVVHRDRDPRSVAAVDTLHVLAYSRFDERLTDIRIPFAVLRWLPSGRVKLRDRRDFDPDLTVPELSVADLERHGPGLVLDHEDPKGTRVLVWTE